MQTSNTQSWAKPLGLIIGSVCVCAALVGSAQTAAPSYLVATNVQAKPVTMATSYSAMPVRRGTMMAAAPATVHEAAEMNNMQGVPLSTTTAQFDGARSSFFAPAVALMGAAVAAWLFAVRKAKSAMDPLELSAINTAAPVAMFAAAAAKPAKVLKPRVRGFICTTTHPVGCEARVREEIEYAKANTPKDSNGPKKVLVIGCSAGYGLSTRIASAFGHGAATMGVFRAAPGKPGKTGSAGWYNTIAFEKAATEAGLYHRSVCGDAFTNETKEAVVKAIKEDLGQVDLVCYSVAAPKRVDPVDGTEYWSCLKPIGEDFTNRTLMTDKGTVTEVTLEAANDKEVADTVKVMGGEDWDMWLSALSEGGVLAPGAKTVAYSYIGPQMTYPVYWSGTIGAAKKDVEKTAVSISEKYDCEAYTAVAKALVTQASSAIPVVPLYICLLYKVMKEMGNHEGCIEQMVRMLNEKIYTADGKVVTDDENRIRIDDWEMSEPVQEAVQKTWNTVSTENLKEVSDYAGYQEEFLKLFGFGIDGVDYTVPCEVDLELPSATEYAS